MNDNSFRFTKNDLGVLICCPECGSHDLVKDGKKVLRGGVTKQAYRCRTCGFKTVNPDVADEEVIRENLLLAKQKQAAQDKNRIQTKSFREDARIENAIAELSKHMEEVLENNKKDFPTIKHREKKRSPVGIVHLSDLHFMELVDLDHNKYDFKVASKRLQKHVFRATQHFKSLGVKKVLLAVTGDLMNSDRRLDEVYAQACSRSQALFLASYIMEQIVLDLNKNFNVDVAWVCGNEGRVNQELGFTQIMVSDNYDYMIMRMVEKTFEGKKGVNFCELTDPSEQLVSIHGVNVLLVHGHVGGRAGKLEDKVRLAVSKYAARNIIVDYVLSGHIHQAYVSDRFARSGSPVGDNAYSDKGLGLSGKASQNYHIVWNDKSIDGHKVDLQMYEDFKGYDMDEKLAQYNATGVPQDSGTTILKIII